MKILKYVENVPCVSNISMTSYILYEYPTFKVKDKRVVELLFILYK